MSRQYLKSLLNARMPELQVAQSETTSGSDILIDGPVRLLGYIFTASSGTAEATLFDGDDLTNTKIHVGDISAPGRVQAFCPGVVNFSDSLRISQTAGVATFQYTLFFQRPGV